MEQTAVFSLNYLILSFNQKAKTGIVSIITALMCLASMSVHSQARSVKIGYIDMEYILQNVPEYADLKNQLEQKAQRWKGEIEQKKNDIAKLKEALKSERALLTKELLEEREEEISIIETELFDFQQKKFGPTGELVVQKTVLVKPIQDQVFNIVQDIAEAKKYDFVFDRSSDLTILFAGKRYDISDQVLRKMNRTTRQQQMSKKQIKEEQIKEKMEDMIDQNPALEERKKKLEERKAARELAVAEKRAAAEEKKKQNEARKAQGGKSTTDTKGSGTVSDGTTPKSGTADGAAESSAKSSEAANDREAKRKQVEAERAQKAEERKLAIENKRKEAEAAKAAKAAERKEGTTAKKDSVNAGDATTSAENRKKSVEDRKKEIEERRKKVLEDREAKKKQREDAKKQKQADSGGDATNKTNTNP